MAITIRPTPHLKDEQANNFLVKVREKENSKISFSAQKEKAQQIIAKANAKR